MLSFGIYHIVVLKAMTLTVCLLFPCLLWVNTSHACWTSFVLSGLGRGVYLALWDARVRRLHVSPQSSPDGTKKATTKTRVLSSNPGDITFKGQINKWPHKTLRSVRANVKYPNSSIPQIRANPGWAAEYI